MAANDSRPTMTVPSRCCGCVTRCRGTARRHAPELEGCGTHEDAAKHVGHSPMATRTASTWSVRPGHNRMIRATRRGEAAQRAGRQERRPRDLAAARGWAGRRRRSSPWSCRRPGSSSSPVSVVIERRTPARGPIHTAETARTRRGRRPDHPIRVLQPYRTHLIRLTATMWWPP